MNEMRLHRQSLGLLLMLIVQFVLGMVLDLFVELPKNHAGTSGDFISRAWHGFIWAVSSGGGIVLTLHVIVAIGLILGSIGLVIRAAILRNRFWLAISIVGALGIFVALTNGLAFIGYGNDVNSFVMAMGFIVAAVAYSPALSVAENPFKSRGASRTRSSRPMVSRKYRPRHT
ncbi:hypothetical protein KW789_00855 [Candidatus Saccharibacteria bacterium]|nr:hypothetical protein [Candidatus Saccharibacteria bacterium]